MIFTVAIELVGDQFDGSNCCRRDCTIFIVGIFFTAVVDNGGGEDVVDLSSCSQSQIPTVLYWNLIVFLFLMTGYSICS